MSTNVILTPELERFARQCVESGEYTSVSEVVRQGLRLLEEQYERRKKFMAMLDDAEAEADRQGTHDIDDVLAEADEIIARSEK
jgi:antitoxin ParD1/3/4